MFKFDSTRVQTRFQDPFNKFETSTLAIETRKDPLSGDQARVLSFRVRPLGPIDHQAYLERSLERPCPFCPQNIERMTTRYLPQDLLEGRLSQGGATLFPNAFPYAAMNAVLVLCQEHYLRPSQFTPELLANALSLAVVAFKCLTKGQIYASVNWNYLMPAGAGLVHPHFQLAAGRSPTRFQAALRAHARAHTRAYEGRDIAADYIQAEHKNGVRWLGRLGPAVWLTPFVPRAIFDVMALVPGDKGLLDLKSTQIAKLAKGISRVLSFFEAQGVGSFNLALHTQLKSGAGLPLMVRLVSRVDIPPMGVDEINYFEKLHDEIITFLPPEELAQRLRQHWAD
ncbi:Galactose-1-phosphate uridylyltransferase [Desulfarculales bacterium]